MAVLFRVLALATAGTSLFIGASSAATLAPRPQHSNLECAPASSLGWSSHADIQDIKASTNSFCGLNQYGAGDFLSQSTPSVTEFPLGSGGHIRVSVNNTNCGPPGMWVDMAGCTTAFNQIESNCNVGTDGINVGGTYATDCGHWSIQYYAEPLAESSTTFLEKRCAQFCYNPATSSCHPPNWATCTDAEKSCLVEYASDDQACLMAGNCIPDC